MKIIVCYFFELLYVGPVLDHQNQLRNFSFEAPTSASNLKRLLRAMQLSKRALLLEGSPGVGKTTLVLALAKISGHEVVRINLSEATVSEFKIVE